MSEQKTHSAPKKRRRSRTNYRPWIKLLLRLLIIGIVALLIFLLVSNWRQIAPISFLDWYDQTIGDIEKGEEFPYTLDGGSVVDMAEITPHLVVVDDASIRFFTDDAACVVNRKHLFADPTLHTAGEYALVTEVGGSRFRLETRRETVLTSEIKNRKIYAGDLSSDGTTAFVTNSSSGSYLSEIYVFDAEGNSIFEYKSGKYLFSDIAISPNGEQLAVTGSTAEGGMLKSAILVITLEDEKVTEHSGTEVLLHNVSYLSDLVILAVGDRQIWTLTGENAKLTKTNCDGVVPIGYAATSSLACVALRRDGATNAGTVWLFDSSGQLVKQMEYTGEFRSVACSENNVIVLTDSMLYEFNASGMRKEQEIPSDALLAAYYEGKPMVVTFGELKRVSK